MSSSAIFTEALARLPRPRAATYRLQLGPTLGFEHVAALGPYLETLGVTDAYLSPCFKSGPGSPHGYDVTDHNGFNPEIGSPATFDRMAAALGSLGIGIILDIVPNHMGIAGDANPWWLDVLENGPSSPYASFFDIEWNPPKPELRNKVLLPVLPSQYGEVPSLQIADPGRRERHLCRRPLVRVPLRFDLLVVFDRADAAVRWIGGERPWARPQRPARLATNADSSAGSTGFGTCIL